MADKIKALFIFEILGRPPEHIKKTMEQLIDKLGEFDGIEISNKKIHAPKPVKKEGVKDLFTTFSEVEILGKDLNAILNVVFYAMPSHVEIIEPDELKFKNFDLSSMLSALTVKLHRYDEIAKAMMLRERDLINKLKELQEKVDGVKESEKEKEEKRKKKSKEEKK